MLFSRLLHTTMGPCKNNGGTFSRLPGSAARRLPLVAEPQEAAAKKFHGRRQKHCRSLCIVLDCMRSFIPTSHRPTIEIAAKIHHCIFASLTSKPQALLSRAMMPFPQTIEVQKPSFTYENPTWSGETNVTTTIRQHLPNIFRADAWKS